MLRNPECRKCELFNYARTINLQGLGNPDTAKLAIFCDAPMWEDDQRRRPFVSRAGEILLNLLGRMSLTTEEVYLDYIVKCFAGKKMPRQKCERLRCVEACSEYRFATLQNMPNVKKIVGMGSLSLEAMVGSSEMKHFEGESWTPRELELRQYGEVWITYSPAYLDEKPAEIPNVYRILFTAAQQAGLDPRPNLSHPHLAWDK